jgi:hypothetical protein
MFTTQQNDPQLNTQQKPRPRAHGQQARTVWKSIPEDSVASKSRSHARSSSQKIEQIETLVIAAMLESHPNSEKAWDHLLDDVVGDAPTLPPEFFDKDWDGLC